MRIHYDPAAARALMALQRSNKTMSVAMERVLSGRRINRAADDAAGLAIAQRLKAQIRCMNQAVRNALDGISLLSTADAGLGQVQQIVHRLRELSVRAASDTLTWRDRLAIQREADELTRELSAITNRTEFNGKNLIGGGLRQALFHVGANAGDTVTVGLNAVDARSLGLTPGVQGYVIEGSGIESVSVDAGAAAAAEEEGALLPSGAYEVRLHQGGGSVVTADGNLVLTTVQPRQFTLEIAAAPPPNTYTYELPVDGATGDGAAGEASATLTFNSAFARDFHLRLVKATAKNAETAVSWGWNEELGMNVLTVTLGTGSDGNITATWQQVATAINMSGFGVHVKATGAAWETAQELEATVATRATPIPTTATYDATYDATHDATSGALRVVLGRNGLGEVDATWAEVVQAINAIEPPPGITATTSPSQGAAAAYTWPPKLLATGIAFSLVDMDGNVVATQDTVKDDNSVVLAGVVTLKLNAETALLDRIVPATWGLNVIGVVTRESQAAVPAAVGDGTDGTDDTDGTSSTTSTSSTSITNITSSTDRISANGVDGADGRLLREATVEKGVLLDTREHAQSALASLDTALACLSGERASVGALQSSLERTVTNLQACRENLAAAQSRIEDADMTAKVAELTRQQILTHTSTTVLVAASTRTATQVQALLQTIQMVV